MATVIDELVTILGFDMDSRAGATLDKFNKGINSITSFAKTASIAITATAASLSYFVLKTTKASDEIEKLGRVTGISTDTIQEMSFALEQVGGSVSTMHSDLEKLMMSMNSPIPGEFNQGLFLLDISTKKASGALKTVDEVLMDIADKMQGMTKQKQMQWGAKIGISKDTIMLLQEGRGEIERLRKQAAQMPVIIDPENLKNAREFNRQLSLLSRIFGFLGQTIASTAGPALKELVTSFAEWTSKNKEVITSGLLVFIEGVTDGFSRFADVVNVVFTAISDLIPEMNGLTDAFTAIDVISGLVLGVLVALSIPLAILAAKFLLIAGVVTLFALAIEDLVVYLRGGNSAIGELIKKVTEMWEVFGQKFPAMADFLKEFWDVLGTFASFLKDVFFYVLDKFIKLLGLVAKGWGLLAGLAEKGLKKLGFGDDKPVLEVKIKEVIEEAKPYVAKAQKVVREVIEKVEPIITKKRDAIFERMQEVVEPTKKSDRGIIEEEVPRNSMLLLVAVVKDGIRKAMQPTKTAIHPVQEVIKPVKETVKPVKETVKEVIKEVIKPVKETVKETVKEVIKPVKETVKEVIKPVKETVKEVIKPVKEVIKPVKETVKEVIKPVKETVKEVIKPIRAVRETIREIMQPVKEKIQETTREPTRAVQKTIEEVVQPSHKKMIPSPFDVLESFIKASPFGVLESFIKKNNTNNLASSPIATQPITNTTTSSNQQTDVKNTVNIEITGDNAPAVASEVAHTLNTTLYQLYPGGLAPAVQ